MSTLRAWVVVAVVAVLLVPGVAVGASLGTFCWQTLPFIDVVCFNLDDSATQADLFVARGTDNGATYRYPIVGGLSFDEHKNLFRLTWTTFFIDSGFSGGASFGANINPNTGQGSWLSNFGGQGALLYIGQVSASAASLQAAPTTEGDLETFFRKSVGGKMP